MKETTVPYAFISCQFPGRCPLLRGEGTTQQERLLPESHGQNLVLTVVHVPRSLDSGKLKPTAFPRMARIYGLQTFISLNSRLESDNEEEEPE